MLSSLYASICVESRSGTYLLLSISEDKEPSSGLSRLEIAVYLETGSVGFGAMRGNLGKVR